MEGSSGIVGQDPTASGPRHAWPGTPARVLIVEDNLELISVYRRYLATEAVAIDTATTGRAALQRLAEDSPAAVLLDLRLPDMGGQEILERIRAERLPTTVIVLTGCGSIDSAVEAMRAGAYDFLAKPVDGARLRVALRNALERQSLSHLVESYRQSFERDRFRGFVGASPPMQAVYRMIERAAPSRACVFITGESGTGKEICARAIHDCSPRRDGPFIAINCGAIPRELFESELFGHTRGAFTGAVTTRAGAAQQANGGTLFLDELCEMEPAAQAKLLRFVQSGTLRKVGGERHEKVDVRLVCATNRDPLDAVARGQLREDIYYRLRVIPIHMPPLRERPDDILPIARHFLAVANREERKDFGGFSPQAAALLSGCPWPGNVRQLQNAIRTAVILNAGETVQAEMLRGVLCPADRAPAEDRAAGKSGCFEQMRMRPLREAERDLIEVALARCRGNVRRAAELLQVSPSTIYRRLKSGAQSASG